MNSAARLIGSRNDSSNVVFSLGFQRGVIGVDLPAGMVSPEAVRDHPSSR